MVKTSETAKTVSITPDVGESLLITDIQIVPNAAVTEFITISTNRRTVGYFHVGTLALNQLAFQGNGSTIKTVIKQLGAKGFNLTYPIADGETMTITAPNNWSVLRILYESYDSGDIKSDAPNGSKADEYFYLQYGKNLSAITAIDDYLLTGIHNPAEFPGFPFAAVVPSKTTIEMFGIASPDTSRSGAAKATDSLVSSRIKLFRDREVLFDKDKLGLWVKGAPLGNAANTATEYNLGSSSLFYGGKGTYKDIFTFESPLVFNEGEELSVFINFILDGGGGTIAIGDLYVCLPLHVKRSA